jgi:hypothetical protein
MAQAAGVSPGKMCAMNRNGLESLNCSNLELGHQLRVPNDDACQPYQLVHGRAILSKRAKRAPLFQLINWLFGQICSW